MQLPVYVAPAARSKGKRPRGQRSEAQRSKASGSSEYLERERVEYITPVCIVWLHPFSTLSSPPTHHKPPDLFWLRLPGRPFLKEGSPIIRHQQPDTWVRWPVPPPFPHSPPSPHPSPQSSIVCSAGQPASHPVSQSFRFSLPCFLSRRHFLLAKKKGRKEGEKGKKKKNPRVTHLASSIHSFVSSLAPWSG